MDLNRIGKALNVNRIFWAVCFLLLAANLVFRMTILRSQQNEISRQIRTYESLRTSRVPGQDQAGYHRYESGRKELETFLQALPRMPNISDKARELRSLLNDNHISSGEIRFSTGREDALSLWKYSTTLSISGTYPDMKRFLAAIQGSASLFAIEHLSFERRESAGTVSAGLRIATYCR